MKFKLAAALFVLPPGPAAAAAVLVVLSEPPRASHRRALAGLLAEWGGPVATAPDDRPLPSGPYEVIIALGGRAADRAAEASAPCVVALAPGYRRHSPPAVRVAMTPSPERVVELLAAAGVHRLLSLRQAPPDADFARRASAAGSRSGVVIEETLMSSASELPSLLRRAGPAYDGVWLAPDPASVTRQTFAAAREFSRARSIPFFAPAAGLADAESRGDLSIGFEECGREAARAARSLLKGEPVPRDVYPR